MGRIPKGVKDINIRTNLFSDIKRGMEKISLTRHIKFVNSVPDRCAAVIKVNGYATKYYIKTEY